MNTRASRPADRHPDARIESVLAEFETVLQEEYAALRARDLERLERAVQSKNALVGQLEAYAKTLKERPADWDQIKRRLEQCARANRINGGAIQSNRAFVVGLLDIVRGKAPGERTYNSRGRLADSGAAAAFARVI